MNDTDIFNNLVKLLKRRGKEYYNFVYSTTEKYPFRICDSNGDVVWPSGYGCEQNLRSDSLSDLYNHFVRYLKYKAITDLKDAQEKVTSKQHDVNYCAETLKMLFDEIPGIQTLDTAPLEINTTPALPALDAEKEKTALEVKKLNYTISMYNQMYGIKSSDSDDEVIEKKRGAEMMAKCIM